MKIIRLSALIVSIATVVLVVTSTSFAQSQDATPTPTPTPTPTSSPSASENPSTSPTATAAGSTNKEQVLGAATKLGSTSKGREVAKWFMASAFGIVVLLIGLKVLRSNVEE